MFGRGKKTEEDQVLYSAGLDAALQPIVLGLAAPAECRHFRSVLMVESATGAEKWLEAWAHPVTGQWQVDLHQRIKGAGRQQKPLCANACFFDAVACCARWEASEPENFMKSSAVPCDRPYYRAVAEAAGIPFDLQGLPHPAADGVILTTAEAGFDDHAYDVAARTRGKVVKIVAPAAARTDAVIDNVPQTIVSAAPAAAMGTGDVLKSGLKKAQLRELFNNASAAVSEVDSVIRKSIEKDFKKVRSGIGPGSGFGTFLFTMTSPLIMVATDLFTSGLLLPLAFTGVTIPLIVGGVYWAAGSATCCWYDVRYPKASHQFAKAHGALKKATSNLPDSEDREKDMLKSYFRQSVAAFKLEKAVFIRQEVNGNRMKSSRLKEGLSLIKSAAKDLAVSKTEMQSWQQAYANNQFDYPGKFLGRLARTSSSVQSALQARINSL